MKNKISLLLLLPVVLFAGFASAQVSVPNSPAIRGSATIPQDSPAITQSSATIPPSAPVPPSAAASIGDAVPRPQVPLPTNPGTLSAPTDTNSNPAILPPTPRPPRTALPCDYTTVLEGNPPDPYNQRRLEMITDSHEWYGYDAPNNNLNLKLINIPAAPGRIDQCSRPEIEYVIYKLIRVTGFRYVKSPDGSVKNCTFYGAKIESSPGSWVQIPIPRPMKNQNPQLKAVYKKLVDETIKNCTGGSSWAS